VHDRHIKLAVFSLSARIRNGGAMLSGLQPKLRSLLESSRRYRQARIVHAFRVALALLTSIVLTRGVGIPHAEWASITVLVVIGGLQHHGNIRQRAAERAAGTLIGAAVGLLLIVQQIYVGMPLLTYLLMAAACGYCAYHAIGKGGYIALLTAITIVVTAGLGSNDLSGGLWRTVNVLIGNAIALLFSFALPAYATYSWRLRLAALLRASAMVYDRLCARYEDAARLQQDMTQLGDLLIRLRSLMPSVAKETGLPVARFDEIQHSLRICISALELMASVPPRAGAVADAGVACDRQGQDPSGRLMALSHALQLGTPIVSTGRTAAAQRDRESVSIESDAFLFLSRRLSGEIDKLQDWLADIFVAREP
jgi:uncharacterized membrane protein YccC